MVDQFTALRDGDRFFYLNESWTPQESAILQQGNTLTKVIEANTGITNLQSDAFIFKASISGTVSSAAGPPAAPPGHGPHGLGGITVQLEDTTGDVLATTVTNSQGQYTFTQLSGPAANADNASGVSGTGSYDVVLIVPSSLQQVSPSPNSILISVGGDSVNLVNFTLANQYQSQYAAAAFNYTHAAYIYAYDAYAAGTGSYTAFLYEYVADYYAQYAQSYALAGDAADATHDAYFAYYYGYYGQYYAYQDYLLSGGTSTYSYDAYYNGYFGEIYSYYTALGY
jgi:hypothetical protein